MPTEWVLRKFYLHDLHITLYIGLLYIYIYIWMNYTFLARIRSTPFFSCLSSCFSSFMPSVDKSSPAKCLQHMTIMITAVIIMMKMKMIKKKIVSSWFNLHTYVLLPRCLLFSSSYRFQTSKTAIRNQM